MLKKLLIFFIVSILILFAVFYLIAFFAFRNLFAGDGKELSDQEMIVYFQENESRFNKLNEEILLLKDRGLKRIDDTWSDPSELSKIGVSSQDEQRLKKEMEALGIARGVNAYSRDSVEYLAYTHGLSVSGGAKGYFYSLIEPKNYYKEPIDLKITPYLPSEEMIRPKNGYSYTVYKKITDKWYIFEDYED